MRDKKKAAQDLQGYPEDGGASQGPAKSEEPAVDGAAALEADPVPGPSGATPAPSGDTFKPSLKVTPRLQGYSEPTPGVFNLESGDYPEELKSLDLDAFDLSANTNGLLETILGDGLAALQAYPSEESGNNTAELLAEIAAADVDPDMDVADPEELLDFEPPEDSGKEEGQESEKKEGQEQEKKEEIGERKEEEQADPAGATTPEPEPYIRIGLRSHAWVSGLVCLL